MQTNNKKGSSWFLTIVAFVMILFWVGYILSNVLGSTTLAKETGNYEIPTNTWIESQDLQSKEDQEKRLYNNPK